MYYERRESAELEEASRKGRLKVPVIDPHELDFEAWFEYGEHKRIRNMAAHFCLYEDIFGSSEDKWLPQGRVLAEYPGFKVYRGNHVPTDAAAEPPSVSFESKESGRLTLALVTPDGRPYETSPTTVTVHWLVTDLSAGDDVAAAAAAVPYEAVVPHAGAGAYRYALILLAQDEEASDQAITLEPHGRVVDFPAFVAAHSLRPVALSFFQAMSER